MISPTPAHAGQQQQYLQRLQAAVMASSERLADEMSGAFADIDLHLQSPRRASWGADCEWLLSGLQNSSRTALDLLEYAGHRERKEAKAIQRRIMTILHQARVHAQAAGDTVAPIVAASRITSLIATAKEDSASIYSDLRDARARFGEQESRQRSM